MGRPKKSILILICFFFFLRLSYADDKTAEVDGLFAEWDKPDSPGCALAIVKDGQIIYKRGYGMANLELGVPITPCSAFYIGSVSKQFTAFCIALLAKNGKLSLEDDIRKYIPEMPDYGHTISISHLIHHTSGIRDFLELEDIAGLDAGSCHEQEVLELLARQKGLNFAPGEEYLYSNGGYFLLGVIVKRASGQSLREFAGEKIFKPLGMKSSQFQDDYRRLIKDRASGYFPAEKDRYQNFLTTFDCVGSGGLFSSVEDLFLWDQNFYDGRVGGKDLIELMHTQGWLNNGQKLDYAFALTIGTYKGLKTVSHGGALGGYRSMLLRFPDRRFSVIILSNLSSINTTKLARQVADIYLAELIQEKAELKTADQIKPLPKTKPFHPVEPTQEKLKEYEGDYYSDELGVTFKLALREGKLYFAHRNAPRGALQPTLKDRFVLGNWNVSFKRDGEKKIAGFSLDAGRVRNLEFAKKEKIAWP
jgi:CubicO group peptidase (beta-lactamase class C family)